MACLIQPCLLPVWYPLTASSALTTRTADRSLVCCTCTSISGSHTRRSRPATTSRMRAERTLWLHSCHSFCAILNIPLYGMCVSINQMSEPESRRDRGVNVCYSLWRYDIMLLASEFLNFTYQVCHVSNQGNWKKVVLEECRRYIRDRELTRYLSNTCDIQFGLSYASVFVL